MKNKIILLSNICFLLTAHLCLAAEEAWPPIPPDKKENKINILGVVQYVPLEGGFYGLTDTQGKRFMLLDLAKDFQQDGLRVRITGSIANNRMGLHNWGEYLQIYAITPTSCLEIYPITDDN